MPTVESQVENDSGSLDLTRSASYSNVPQLISDDGVAIDVKKTLSEVNLSQLATKTQSHINSADVETGKEILRRATFRSSKSISRRRGSNSNFSQFSLSPAKSTQPSSHNEPDVSQSTASTQRSTKPSISGTLSNLSFRPWKTSRSPSPSHGTKDANTSPEKSKDNSSPLAPRPADIDSKKTGRRQSVGSSASAGLLTKRNWKPTTAISTKGKTEAEPTGPKTPSTRSLHRKQSLERFAASVGLSKADDVPPIPQPTEAVSARRNPDLTKRKDELWHVFRTLDADYQKFHSKSTPLKVNVLRTSLLPCLSRCANHPSNIRLRPEDLDRRTNILNKWWTGLLEMLNGRNSYSITGTDRPVYLEATLAIMARAEWRVPSRPPSSSTSRTTTPKNELSGRSQTSLESAGSDFLMESIYHNVRNIFNQNLLSQMAYAIDRMSMRHTPASLVSFCGKTCAHAFFFCREVADILIRLWNLPPGILRRVINEFHVHHDSTVRGLESDEISLQFPSVVRHLSFSTPSTLLRNLRHNIPIPFAVSHINWFGPWVPRWAGRDTDLFFIFLKHFYILVIEFLPSMDMSKGAYVPGFIPVNAQVLTVFQNTLSKHNGLQPTDALTSTSATFDDFIDGADASAASLPLRPANSLLLMSESRLIMALRDFLTDSSIKPKTKQLFTGYFCTILKLGARKTSLFDHNSCFSLCDFIEELIPIIPPYCHSNDQSDPLDWDFWLDVCDQMMKSSNSLTEVRTIAFIFSAWNAINYDPRRKERLCLKVLLDKQLFNRYFSHWSPMVRGYFHRLLCWRLARYDGEQSDLDIQIYQALADRLGNIWNFFLSRQSAADKGLTAPLSTAPCTPAPGRRIIIIRNDYYAAPPATMFACLGNIVPPSFESNQSSDGEPIPSKHTHRKPDSGPESSPPQVKKSWKMLKTMFRPTTNPKPGEVTPPGSSGSEDTSASTSDNQNTMEDAATQNSENNNGSRSNAEPGASDKSRQIYTFRFCLEWVDRQRWLSRDKDLHPPSLPGPARLFLRSIQNAQNSNPDSTAGSASNSLPGTNSDNGSETDSTSVNQNSPRKAQAPLIKNPTKVSPVTNIGRVNDWDPTASTYAGRALAEWALVVSECDNFFQRRRDEGVPSHEMVEVPTLGVESFRK